MLIPDNNYNRNDGKKRITWYNQKRGPELAETRTLQADCCQHSLEQSCLYHRQQKPQLLIYVNYLDADLQCF